MPTGYHGVKKQMNEMLEALSHGFTGYWDESRGGEVSGGGGRAGGDTRPGKMEVSEDKGGGVGRTAGAYFDYVLLHWPGNIVREDVDANGGSLAVEEGLEVEEIDGGEGEGSKEGTSESSEESDENKLNSHNRNLEEDYLKAQNKLRWRIPTVGDRPPECMITYQEAEEHCHEELLSQARDERLNRQIEKTESGQAHTLMPEDRESSISTLEISGSSRADAEGKLKNCIENQKKSWRKCRLLSWKALREYLHGIDEKPGEYWREKKEEREGKKKGKTETERKDESESDDEVDGQAKSDGVGETRPKRRRKILRGLGVSNFHVAHLKDLYKAGEPRQRLWYPEDGNDVFDNINKGQNNVNSESSNKAQNNVNPPRRIDIPDSIRQSLHLHRNTVDVELKIHQFEFTTNFNEIDSIEYHMQRNLKNLRRWVEYWGLSHHKLEILERMTLATWLRGSAPEDGAVHQRQQESEQSDSEHSESDSNVPQVHGGIKLENFFGKVARESDNEGRRESENAGQVTEEVEVAAHQYAQSLAERGISKNGSPMFGKFDGIIRKMKEGCVVRNADETGNNTKKRKSKNICLPNPKKQIPPQILPAIFPPILTDEPLFPHIPNSLMKDISPTQPEYGFNQMVAFSGYGLFGNTRNSREQLNAKLMHQMVERYSEKINKQNADNNPSLAAENQRSPDEAIYGELPGGYAVGPTDILLKWAQQRGVQTVMATSSVKRMRENMCSYARGSTWEFNDEDYLFLSERSWGIYQKIYRPYPYEIE
jgi:hypothetical protein